MPDPDPGPPADPAPAPRRPREWDKQTKRKAAPHSRSAQLIAALFLLAAFGGALVVYFNLPKAPPKPLLYSFAVERYTDLPELVAAGVDEDSRRLAEAFPDGERAGSDITKLTADAIRGVLKRLADRPADDPRTRDNPLILHLAGVAVVRADTVYLLPADGKRNSPDKWIAVGDILDMVGKCPTVRKLLILDLARPVGDPFSGQLRDDASVVLDKLLRERKPTYPVMVSCGPGQFSWPTAAPSKPSAFGMYLADGLGGLADGADGTPRDGYRITVTELFQFARGRVFRYARGVWGAAQVPFLYAPDRKGWDFDLTNQPLPGFTPHEPLGEPGKYPADLTARWAFLDGVRERGDDRADPMLFARLVGETLLIAERRWRATGDAPDNYADGTVARPADRWKPAGLPSAAGTAAADWKRKVRGLRIGTQADGEPVPPVWKPALDTYLTFLRTKAKNGKWTEDEENKANLAKLDWQAKIAMKPVQAAVLAWRQAAGSLRLTREDVIAYEALLSEVWADRPVTLELLYLRALVRRNFIRDVGLPEHPADAIAAALAAEEKLAQALALDPEAFVAVADRLTAADEARAQAMTRLFELKPGDDVGAVTAAFRKASGGFVDAESAANRARSETRTVRDAAETLVNALPLVLTDDDLYPVWRAAAGRAARGSVNDVDALGDGLRKLAAPFDKAAVEQALKHPGPWADPKELLRYERLVAGPTFRDFRAEQRRDVWNQLRMKRRDLHNEVRKADDKDDEAHEPTGQPSDAVPTDERVVGRRAGASLALLELSAAANVADVRRAVDAMEARPDDGGRIEATGKALALAWAAVAPGPVVPPGAALTRGQPAGAALPPDRGDSGVGAYLRWVARQLGGYRPLEPLDPEQKYFGQRLELDPNPN